MAQICLSPVDFFGYFFQYFCTCNEVLWLKVVQDRHALLCVLAAYHATPFCQALVA